MKLAIEACRKQDLTATSRGPSTPLTTLSHTRISEQFENTTCRRKEGLTATPRGPSTPLTTLSHKRILEQFEDTTCKRKGGLTATLEVSLEVHSNRKGQGIRKQRLYERI